jgi:hypothetical protein
MQTDRQAGRQTDMQTDRRADRQIDRTDRQADMQTFRQTGIQTGRQTGRDTTGSFLRLRHLLTIIENLLKYFNLISDCPPYKRKFVDSSLYQKNLLEAI